MKMVDPVCAPTRHNRRSPEVWYHRVKSIDLVCAIMCCSLWTKWALSNNKNMWCTYVIYITIPPLERPRAAFSDHSKISFISTVVWKIQEYECIDLVRAITCCSLWKSELFQIMRTCDVNTSFSLQYHHWKDREQRFLMILNSVSYLP